MNDLGHDPITRWAAALSAVLLALVLILGIVQSVRGPSLAERMDELQSHLEFQTCLLLTAPEERAEAAVSTCLPNGDTDG